MSNNAKGQQARAGSNSGNNNNNNNNNNKKAGGAEAFSNLKAAFPNWDDEDLRRVLDSAGGSVELAVEKILNGDVVSGQTWMEVKTKKERIADNRNKQKAAQNAKR